MAIIYHRQTDYAARPRAPRRTGHQAAQHDEKPGQVNLFEVDRAKSRAAAMRHVCPACHAPQGMPCTRKPTFAEGKERQPLGYMCHPQRHALADERQGVDESEEDTATP